MSKKVAIAPPRRTPEDWVKQKPIVASNEPMKRLTVDIPEDLHTKIKTVCAQNRQKIADVVRAMLEERFTGSKAA